MKILIIDQDEEHASRLSRLLTSLNESVEILPFITSVEQGVRWLISKPVCDLIFTDYELPDGSCFDIFREAASTTPVIFTSVTAAHALRSYRLNCIDYLIKPVEKNGLISSLYKLGVLKELFQNPGLLPEKEAASRPVNAVYRSYKSRFVIHLGDKIRYILSSQIAYFRADGNLVYLITTDNKSYIADQSLEEITELVDPALFFRINRSFLCQVGAIQEIRRYFNSRLKIYLHPEPGEDEVLVSRNRVQEFLTWLGH